MENAAARYWLAQIPGWGLAFVVLGAAWSFLGLPGWAAIAVAVLLVVKDVALYPFAVRALRSPPHAGPAALLAARGVAVHPLAPGAEGRVRIGAEEWRAELAAGEGPVEQGAPVRVEALHGLRLVVRAAADEADSAA
jgi:membrane protein implicated in regulation of membrane protease activity